MPVDKFGHRRRHANERVKPYMPKVAHTPDGNIDAENVRICNVKAPTTNSDAVNKLYVDEQMQVYHNELGALQKTINSTLQTQLVSHQNKINDINTFILRNPPVAGRDMATKKYVDDVIVVTKDYMRQEFKSFVQGFGKIFLKDIQQQLQEKINEHEVSINELRTNYLKKYIK